MNDQLPETALLLISLTVGGGCLFYYMRIGMREAESAYRRPRKRFCVRCGFSLGENRSGTCSNCGKIAESRSAMKQSA